MNLICNLFVPSLLPPCLSQACDWQRSFTVIIGYTSMSEKWHGDCCFLGWEKSFQGLKFKYARATCFTQVGQTVKTYYYWILVSMSVVPVSVCAHLKVVRSELFTVTWLVSRTVRIISDRPRTCHTFIQIRHVLSAETCSRARTVYQILWSLLPMQDHFVVCRLNFSFRWFSFDYGTNRNVCLCRIKSSNTFISVFYMSDDINLIQSFCYGWQGDDDWPDESTGFEGWWGGRSGWIWLPSRPWRGKCERWSAGSVGRCRW